MTKVAAMTIYDKNLKKSSSPDQKADDRETWYAASGAWVLPNLFKQWPWVDHDLILRQGQVWSLMLLYGKNVK